jgi:hypothetical protein
LCDFLICEQLMQTNSFQRFHQSSFYRQFVVDYQGTLPGTVRLTRAPHNGAPGDNVQSLISAGYAGSSSGGGSPKADVPVNLQPSYIFSRLASVGAQAAAAGDNKSPTIGGITSPTSVHFGFGSGGAGAIGSAPMSPLPGPIKGSSGGNTPVHRTMFSGNLSISGVPVKHGGFTHSTTTTTPKGGITNMNSNIMSGASTAPASSNRGATYRIVEPVSSSSMALADVSTSHDAVPNLPSVVPTTILATVVASNKAAAVTAT